MCVLSVFFIMQPIVVYIGWCLILSVSVLTFLIFGWQNLSLRFLIHNQRRPTHPHQLSCKAFPAPLNSQQPSKTCMNSSSVVTPKYQRLESINRAAFKTKPDVKTETEKVVFMSEQLPERSVLSGLVPPVPALSEFLPVYASDNLSPFSNHETSSKKKLDENQNFSMAEKLERSQSTEVPPLGNLLSTPFEKPVQQSTSNINDDDNFNNSGLEVVANPFVPVAKLSPGGGQVYQQQSGSVVNALEGQRSSNMGLQQQQLQSLPSHKNSKCAGPPYHGSKSEMGFRTRQEDRHDERVEWYQPEFEHLSNEQIPHTLRETLKTATSLSCDGGIVLKKHHSMSLEDLNKKQTSQSLHLFAVYDGHGGDLASQFCKDNLATNFRTILERKEKGCIQEDCEMDVQDQPLQHKRSIHRGLSIPPVGQDVVADGLREAFLQTDEQYSQSDFENQNLIGSTALVVVLSRNTIYVANCGDSRAVVCRGGQAYPLSDDHKADRKDEVERVEKLGGQILFWNGVRVMGVLNMTRAIGDSQLKPYITSDPEITVLRRHADDQIIIMASDGLWDVFGNQEACNLALRCIFRARQKGATRRAATRVAATVLAKAAIDRGSRDNVTVIVIDLKPQMAEITEADVASATKKQSTGADDKEPKKQYTSVPKVSESVPLCTQDELVNIPPSPFATPFNTGAQTLNSSSETQQVQMDRTDTQSGVLPSHQVEVMT
eukprot:TRINITY_DN299_c0_g3_i1.p1 TRINITY_DN299_c0_g3~~TRINITY_DN299_c0_g3_i1.p1  ORF type:complete len:742 (-),score=61.22 TRINITY_DN299_c0_g3_i1:1314-3461(-)